MINCHTHTFSINNVPDDFLPLKLSKLSRNPLFRKIVIRLLQINDPLTARDIAERLATFIAIMNQESQADIFDNLASNYPKGTKFVVLPMDFEFSGYRPTHTSTEAQLGILKSLAETRPIIPFCPVDPRRPDIMGFVKKWIEDKGFAGLKLYPALGYDVNDSRLDPVYEYACENKTPIITHCGGTSVRGKYISEADAYGKSLPYKYISVLARYNELYLCFAHYGGVKAWQSKLGLIDSCDGSWVDSISHLMKQHPNVYADVSYTIFAHPSFYNYLKVLMTDKSLSKKILFGTDFPLANLEERTEKLVSIDLRAVLGEDSWNMISELNPMQFLGVKNTCV